MRRAVALVVVRVRPRSSQGMVLSQDELVISVAAPPAGGRATEEARRSLAGALGVPPSTVALRAGAWSRVKLFVVSGLDAGQVRARLRSSRG
jgi:uncharacterized protein YggU (UPF0235/DUF167 family)